MFTTEATNDLRLHTYSQSYVDHIRSPDVNPHQCVFRSLNPKQQKVDEMK